MTQQTKAERVEAAARALREIERDCEGRALGMVAHNDRVHRLRAAEQRLDAALALPPDPPLSRETAMRVAETAWRDGDAWMWDGREAESANIPERCAAIVTRVLGELSEVERAEMAVVETSMAAEDRWSKAPIGEYDRKRDAMHVACRALRAARERAAAGTNEKPDGRSIDPKR